MILRLIASNGKNKLDIPGNTGNTFAQAIWSSGQIPQISICGGKGLCGKCRIRFFEDPPLPVSAEEKVFSKDEIESGWRLACRHSIPPQKKIIKIGIPKTVLKDTEDGEYEKLCLGDAENGVLGIDLGTTSVQWQAMDRTGSSVLAKGHFHNPQGAMGADIVSRLEEARKGKKAALAGLVWNRLKTLLHDLEREKIHITRACIAANSALTCLLFDKNTAGLCKAPFSLDYAGNEIICPPDFIPVVIPTLPGPFIGGDISAGLCYLLEEKIPFPFILADLGTNGEMALMTGKEKLYCASIPMGPALEGTGPELGALPGPDIAVRFRLSATGLQAFDSRERPLAKTTGISATGYISLLALLVKMGILTRQGNFNMSSFQYAFMAKKFFLQFDETRMRLFLNPQKKLFISATDIEKLLFIKAAFSTALRLLVKKAGLTADAIRQICFGGALGQYVNYQDLVELGFFPPGLLSRVKSFGNTSLKGACMLAVNPQKLEEIGKLREQYELVELAGNADFERLFLEALNWKKDF